jgi:hypothetical protein
MTQVIITTSTPEEMKKVLAMARKANIHFETTRVNTSHPDKDTATRLSADDWSSPGRSATADEIDEHFEMISKQQGGITLDELDKVMVPWIKSL